MAQQRREVLLEASHSVASERLPALFELDEAGLGKAFAYLPQISRAVAHLAYRVA